METFGYFPVSFTEGLWKHDTNDTIFTLVVDDFFIKYTYEANAEHFLNTPRKNTLSQLIEKLKIYRH